VAKTSITIFLASVNFLILFYQIFNSIMYLTVTVLLHIVTIIRMVIKYPKERRRNCPKYHENQLARLFFFIIVYFNYFKNSRILIVVVSHRSS